MLVANDELRYAVSLKCISMVMRRNRLGWFGHIERMGDSTWVKGVRSMNAEGKSVCQWDAEENMD